MTTVIRTWPDSLFYFSGAGSANIAEQLRKVQVSGKLLRVLSDAGTVDSNGDSLQDRLLGVSLGDLNQRHKWRVLYDNSNDRFLVQRNTGTDASNVWSERFRIDASGNVTTTGTLTTAGQVTTGGKLVLGGDLDMNGFYLRNADNIASSTLRVTGTATFSNNHTLGLVYISSLTASASPIIQFSGLSQYSKYVIELSGVRPTADALSLLMQVSTNNGASFTASGYATAGTLQTNFPASGNVGSSGATAWNLIGDGTTTQDNAAASALDGTVKINNRGSATLQARGRAQCEWVESSGIFSASTDIGLFISPGAAITAVRFFYFGSTIASGTFRLYGVRES